MTIMRGDILKLPKEGEYDSKLGFSYWMVTVSTICMDVGSDSTMGTTTG
jgi:hypothetical protein